MKEKERINYNQPKLHDMTFVNAQGQDDPCAAGTSATSYCTDGTNPYDSGRTYCQPGNTGLSCENGADAGPVCSSGTDGFGTGGCGGGSEPSTACINTGAITG